MVGGERPGQPGMEPGGSPGGALCRAPRSRRGRVASILQSRRGVGEATGEAREGGQIGSAAGVVEVAAPPRREGRASPEQPGGPAQSIVGRGQEMAEVRTTRTTPTPLEDLSLPLASRMYWRAEDARRPIAVVAR